jgi:hypothetical protein
MSDEHQWREVWNNGAAHTVALGSELDDVYMTGASAVVALRELRARVIEIADRAATAASDPDIDVRIGEALADLALLGEELRRR